MDGYALHTDSLNGIPCTLPISQRIPAGIDPLPLQPGTAARIFTGAVIPPGANAVIMQENTCQDQEGRITFRLGCAVGENILATD